MKYLCIFICMFLMSMENRAASFDCKKAETKVEKMICSDQDASNLDHELSRVYGWKLNWASDDVKSRFKRDQIDWLKNTRSRCKDVECIKDEYKIRLYEISRISSKHENHTFSYGGHAYDVLNLFSSNDRVESFNKSGAIHAGGSIRECSVLIMIGVGTARGNRSYGGYCTFQSNNQVVNVNICDDEMVGHFKMEVVDDVSSVNTLSRFVVDNCYGG